MILADCDKHVLLPEKEFAISSPATQTIAEFTGAPR